jgi:hypothetical protein
MSSHPDTLIAAFSTASKPGRVTPRQPFLIQNLNDSATRTKQMR